MDVGAQEDAFQNPECVRNRAPLALEGTPPQERQTWSGPPWAPPLEEEDSLLSDHTFHCGNRTASSIRGMVTAARNGENCVTGGARHAAANNWRDPNRIMKFRAVRSSVRRRYFGPTRLLRVRANLQACGDNFVDTIFERLQEQSRLEKTTDELVSLNQRCHLFFIEFTIKSAMKLVVELPTTVDLSAVLRSFMTSLTSLIFSATEVTT